MQQYKHDKELVSIREFAGRLAITQSSVKQSLGAGTIKKDKKSTQRKILIDFTTQAPKYISASPDPGRYTPKNVAKRIAREPKLAHLSNNIKIRQEEIERRKQIMGSGILPEAIDSESSDSSPSVGRSRKIVDKASRERRGETNERDERMEDSITVANARARRELWRAEREKFNLDLLKGKVIKFKYIENDWVEIATKVRILLEDLPDRIDATLLGLITCSCGQVNIERTQINEALRNEIRQILKALSYNLKKKAEKYARLSKSNAAQEDEDEDDED